MATKPTTIDEYLATVPENQLELVNALLATIRENADPAFEEGLQYGMPAFFLPHCAYPAGYHCDPKQPLPFASVAARKGSVSLYLFCMYCDEDEVVRFREDWKATGNRLDMGKSCIRVKKLERVPLDVVGATVARITAKKFIAAYEKVIPATRRKPAKKTTKRTATKRTA